LLIWIVEGRDGSLIPHLGDVRVRWAPRYLLGLWRARWSPLLIWVVGGRDGSLIPHLGDVRRVGRLVTYLGYEGHDGRPCSFE